MDQEILLPNNWAPRPDQRPLWDYFEDGGFNAVEIAHRRFGKDDIGLHMTAVKAHERIGTYWHMLPEYSQARKAIWTAVNPRTGKVRIDEAFPPEIRAQVKEQEMFIKFKCGSTWQLVGSDSYNSLVGSPPIGVVHSEFALADPRARLFLSPILAENKGWQLFITTPRGNNHAMQLYDYAKVTPGWFAELLTVDDTTRILGEWGLPPVFSKEILEQEHQNFISTFHDEGEMLYQQEYFCSRECMIYGSYYAKQIAQARKDGRICSVPWTAGHAVNTFWDLGMNDAMAIWFIQPIGREFRVIDYYEASGYGLEHYAKLLKEKPYVYGDHYFPHDVAVRELGTGVSRQQTAENLGIKPIVVVERAKDIQSVLNGIEAGRNIFSQCWFDEKKCGPRGIPCLQNYHARYDDDRKTLVNHPEHDWSSNGSDAWRCFAVGYKEKIKIDPMAQFPNRKVNYYQQGQSQDWMGR